MKTFDENGKVVDPRVFPGWRVVGVDEPLMEGDTQVCLSHRRASTPETGSKVQGMIGRCTREIIGIKETDTLVWLIYRRTAVPEGTPLVPDPQPVVWLRIDNNDELMKLGDVLLVNGSNHTPDYIAEHGDQAERSYLVKALEGARYDHWSNTHTLWRRAGAVVAEPEAPQGEDNWVCLADQPDLPIKHGDVLLSIAESKGLSQEATLARIAYLASRPPKWCLSGSFLAGKGSWNENNTDTVGGFAAHYGYTVWRRKGGFPLAARAKADVPDEWIQLIDPTELCIHGDAILDNGRDASDIPDGAYILTPRNWAVNPMDTVGAQAKYNRTVWRKRGSAPYRRLTGNKYFSEPLPLP